MNGIPPIVVGYDGSLAAKAALTWAATEAERINAPVRIVLVLHWPPQLAAMLPAPAVFPDERARREAEKMVRLATEMVRRQRPSLAVTGHVRVGTIVPDLVSESTRARVMVLGHGGHGGFSRLLSGSVGVNVAAQAHCPVVILGHAAAGPGHHDPSRHDPTQHDPSRDEPSLDVSSHDRSVGQWDTDERPDHGWGLSAADQVLVGFDYAPCAAKAIDVAFRAAAGWGIGVHLLRAWRPPVARWGGPDVAEDPEQQALAEHLAVVDAIQSWRRIYPRVPVTVDLVADEPGHALITHSVGARLLVVGSCGHGTVRCLLFGSVSRRVARHARCPVIVVRELPDSEIRTATA